MKKNCTTCCKEFEAKQINRYDVYSCSKECSEKRRSLYLKEYNKNNKEKSKKYHKEYKEKNTEKIKKRHQEYYKNNKEKLKEKHKQYRIENKEEIKKDKKRYYNEHINEIKIYNSTYSKIYYERNKEKLRNQSRIYKQTPEYKKRKNELYKERIKNDPSYKLPLSISGHIRYGLKIHGGFKNKEKCFPHLPYTWDELEKHIESQFEDWMTWNNWGKYNYKTWDDNDQSTWTWNIDHIIPISKLPHTSMEDENFKICWSLSNLRPLSAKQNLIDGNRR